MFKWSRSSKKASSYFFGVFFQLQVVFLRSFDSFVVYVSYVHYVVYFVLSVSEVSFEKISYYVSPVVPYVRIIIDGMPKS